ncbi:tetratricopeptide repeat protein [Micromonospora sp. NPDC005806]|uniref:tetratricopeptide repeat protein n=1 Tax=Micromonospora sp. NPDC005806 TaxID=3364234 RepID=UPI0036773B32
MEPQSGHGDDAVARARELVLAEQFEPAIALLRKHLTTHPDDGVAWRRLAGALIGLGHHPSAVKAAGRAIEANPEDVAAYRYRALARHLLTRDRESYADAKRAVELAPNDHEALSLLAWNVLRVDRDAARLKELVQRALTVNPSSPAARGAVRGYRRIHRRTMAAAVLLAALPPGVMLLFRWLVTVDTLSSDDARWVIWAGVVALAASFVGTLLGRPAPGALPLLTLPQVVATMSAAGIIAAGAGYGATRGVLAAAALGLASAAISGFFAFSLYPRGARGGRVPGESTNGRRSSSRMRHARPETDLS